MVFISDSQFTFKTLRPSGSKLLTEDPNFRQAHDRLSSESVFVYFDVASVEKEEQERMLRMQEEEKKRQESAAANPTPPEVAESGPVDQVPSFAPEELPPAELGPPQPAEDESTSQTVSKSELHLETPVEGFPGLDRLASALLFGSPKWPDAIGVAINFDADTYIVRALMISGPETKGKCHTLCSSANFWTSAGPRSLLGITRQHGIAGDAFTRPSADL